MDLLLAFLEYGAMSLSLYLEGALPTAELTTPLTRGLTQEDVVQAREDMMAQMLALQGQGQTVRLNTIILACDRDALPVLTISLALLLQQCPEIQPLLTQSGAPEITLEFANEVLAYQQESQSMFFLENYAYKEATFARVNQILWEKPSTLPFYKHPLIADERLAGYLCGSDTLDVAVAPMLSIVFAQDELQSLFTNKDLLSRVEYGMTYRGANPHPRLQISGEQGMGKRLLVSHACKKIGCNAIFVEMPYLLTYTGQNLKDAIKFILREQIFYDAAIVFHGIAQESVANATEIKEVFLRSCYAPLAHLQNPVVFCTDWSVSLIPFIEHYVEAVAIHSLQNTQRVSLWKGYAYQYQLNLPSLEMVASKFKLSAHEIQKAAQRLAHLAEHDVTLTSSMVAKTCGQVLPPLSQGNIKKVTVQYTLDDLKLPEEQKQILLNICAHVNCRTKVYDEWGMNEKYAYGKNVSALLVGPPGTGKTMAVHVLSNLLNLPLYTIDLSQVVDKYIGETEKRLEDIFITAEKNNVILFFDEADSIFGKRSEVNDAKDKYANTEVSYILQRIERYEGIVLLASNYKKNIDEAFMRRIRYMMEFQMPDAALRKAIWKSSFGKGVPLQDIDFDFLARQFELSGGSIKNIVLNATFQAAEQGCAVGMQAVLKSLRMENHKMSKAMIRQDFAEYGYLF